MVPSPSPIFVGRELELARLEAALSGAGSDRAALTVAVIYGVAGVGKSALAYAFAARFRSTHGERSVVYRRARSEPLGVLCDDVRRQLAGEAVAEMTDDDERLADLAARLDAGPSLLVLDDLHLLEPRVRSELVGALAGTLRGGRVVATARELVAVGPSGPDRLEVHLDGLDREAARALWGSLDELYGPAAGFEAATERARGNPFALRRAHAGGLDDDDPIDAAVRALSPDERRVAGALALAEWRLPLRALSSLFEGGKHAADRARAAVRRLVTLLIAEVDGAGTCGVQNLFQDALRANLEEEERFELHSELARLIPLAGFDVVIRVREVTRHLAAAGRYDEAGRYLVQNAVDVVRAGATAELLRGLETIPFELRGPDVQLARARCLVRMLDRARGYDELERLVAAGVPPVHEIKFSLGTTAYMMGRVDVGERLLRELLEDRTITPSMRLQVLMQYAWMLTSLGRGEEARAELARAEHSAPDPEQAALLAFYRAVSLWSDERDDELEEAVRRLRALMPEAAPPYATGNLVPPLLAAMLARLGRVQEAQEMLAVAESRGARGEDLQSQLQLGRMRGSILYEIGDRIGALSALRAVALAYERSGSLVSALVANAWVGRILLVMGRRQEGMALLDTTGARAAARGLGGVSSAVERSRAEDPLAWVGQERAPDRRPARDDLEGGGKRGEATRARAQGALRAAAAGRSAEALALASATEQEATGPGYGLDRALAHLARSLVARVEGRAAEATAGFTRAEAAAAEDDVDDGLVRMLLERVGGPVMVTGTARRAAPDSAPDLARFDVVLDGRIHELRVKRRVVSLKRRPVLRRLLYALASQPNVVLSKEALAACLWTSRYDPLRHDNALWVNLRRLRMLLAKSGLEVELSEDGYRLTVPANFVYVAV